MSLPVFPSTLGELYAAAHADLSSPKNGVKLKWSFWLAQARGRLEAARTVAAHVNNVDRDTRAAAIYHALQPSIYDERMSKAPAEKEMALVRSALVESVAMESACIEVLELLGGARK